MRKNAVSEADLSRDNGLSDALRPGVLIPEPTSESFITGTRSNEDNKIAKCIPVSVLISTYAQEHPLHLDEALKSIFDQTALPLECVLVFDGPVPESLKAIADRYATNESLPLVCVELPENVGLAAALNAGLQVCRGQWIARMDSDDISVPGRLEAQWSIIQDNPSLDVVCSWQAEFDENPDELLRIKKSPSKHETIVEWLKWRNHISHPSVVIRRDALEAVGNYRSDFPLLEDWDLWVRLARSGACFFAIQEPLLKMRVKHSQRVRRGGFRLALTALKFKKFCYDCDFISTKEFLMGGLSYSIFTLLPARLKGFSYRLVRTPNSRESATDH